MRFIAAALAAFFAAAALAAPAATPLSPLARALAARREALLKAYQKRLKDMVEGPGWPALPPDERKAKLDELSRRFRADDAKLTADEWARRRAASDADSAAARQRELDRLDEIRVQAAQDMRRGR